MTRFYAYNGYRYRALILSGFGAWVICYEEPAAPFFVSASEVDRYERIETPEAFVKNMSAEKVTKAQEARLELIKPLLCDERCITDKSHRNQVVKAIAEDNHTSERRLIRLYYRYLATGTLIVSKQRSVKRNSDYDWAIRTFYFSSKRLPLRAAYEAMLIERFTAADGRLLEDAPSWKSFEHYYYRNGYHRSPAKIIAREGMTAYQRNHRLIYGSAEEWKTQTGCYQMDATQADIYLVSRFDRSSVIGRPYIYLAVDTATQIIAGVYVGFESNEWAVMSCLANAASDKVSYCKRHHLEIGYEQWPCRGVPHEIITDKGREFCGQRMNEFCLRYGTELQIMPPFRPDRKGLVEKAFDLIQERYKPLLRGKGVIEGDAQERWATDYRGQAVLNLDEFTEVILHCILFLNAGRQLHDGKTPAQHWMEIPGNLLEVESQEIYCMSLKRVNAKMTRKGIGYNGLWYMPEDRKINVDDKCKIAVNDADTSEVYLVEDGRYYCCPLAERSIQYANMDKEELAAQRKRLREQKKIGHLKERDASIASTKSIQQIITYAENNTEAKAGGKQNGNMIAQDQKREREKLQ